MEKGRSTDSREEKICIATEQLTSQGYNDPMKCIDTLYEKETPNTKLPADKILS